MWDEAWLQHSLSRSKVSDERPTHKTGGLKELPSFMPLTRWGSRRNLPPREGPDDVAATVGALNVTAFSGVKMTGVSCLGNQHTKLFTRRAPLVSELNLPFECGVDRAGPPVGGPRTGSIKSWP